MRDTESFLKNSVSLQMMVYILKSREVIVIFSSKHYAKCISDLAVTQKLHTRCRPQVTPKLAG